MDAKYVFLPSIDTSGPSSSRQDSQIDNQQRRDHPRLSSRRERPRLSHRRVRRKVTTCPPHTVQVSLHSIRRADIQNRPFIDVKIFKANLRISIRTLTKDKEHTADIPLSSVVEIVGKAAFSAAKKWNKVAAKKSGTCSRAPSPTLGTH